MNQKAIIEKIKENRDSYKRLKEGMIKQRKKSKKLSEEISCRSLQNMWKDKENAMIDLLEDCGVKE